MQSPPDRDDGLATSESTNSHRRKRVPISLNDKSYAVLWCLLDHLSARLYILQTEFDRSLVAKDILLARLAIDMLDRIISFNPQVIVLDHRDATSNVVLFVLNTVCANVVETLDHAPVCADCTMAALHNAKVLGTPYPEGPTYATPWAAPPPPPPPPPGYVAPNPAVMHEEGKMRHRPKRTPVYTKAWNGCYVDGKRVR